MALKVTPPPLPVFINWKGLVPTKLPKTGLGSFFWDKITGFLACLRSLVCFWPSFSKRDVTVLESSPDSRIPSPTASPRRSSSSSPAVSARSASPVASLAPSPALHLSEKLSRQFKRALREYTEGVLGILENGSSEQSINDLKMALHKEVTSILWRNGEKKFTFGTQNPLFQQYLATVWMPKITKHNVNPDYYKF